MNIGIEHKRNGHLHVKLSSSVTESYIEEVIPEIATQYTGGGNIFINTEKVESITSESARKFCSLIQRSSLPKNKLYMIGKHGFELGADQFKVIVRPPKKDRCGGCKAGRCATIQ